MTRIVAGALGGRRITAPPGSRTRPTADRVREALFSTLDAMTELTGARFADLYAGSGAVGLEALSRGASHAFFVEFDAKAIRAIRDNLSALGTRSRATVQSGKVLTVLGATMPDEPFDVVFADPPYDVPPKELTAALAALADGGWLAADAVVVVERATRSGAPSWPAGITQVRGRRYGETTLWYGRRS